MKRLIIVSILSAVLLSGCSDDSDKAFDPVVPSLTLKEFPHKIGDWWLYAVEYTDPDGFDTLRVTVMDSIGYDCGDVDCSYYSQTWRFEYLRYTVNTTTLWDYYEGWTCYLNLMGRPFEVYLPLSVGDCWVCPYTQDTIEVSGWSKVELESGATVECFELATHYQTYSYAYEIVVTVGAGVGVVEGRFSRAYLHDPEVAPWVAEWRLLDWRVQ